jgi:lipopolysaccharide/colanic/teichoic acid biosynthesis glycosyltransferase
MKSKSRGRKRRQVTLAEGHAMLKDVFFIILYAFGVVWICVATGLLAIAIFRNPSGPVDFFTDLLKTYLSKG